MEKLDINLDDDFKNIDASISNNDSIGIELLINSDNNNSNMDHSPKPSNGYNSGDEVKSEKSEDYSFFRSDNNESKNISVDPVNDPIMNNIASDEYKPVHVLSQTDIKNEK
jgi:hypothetical protein